MTSYNIYTDGGGGQGPGSWAFVIIDSKNNQIIAQRAGREEDTTNNRMELMAVIKALKYCRENWRKASYHVWLNTDSQYVQKGITEWIHKWKKNGWKTYNNKPVKNQELWQDLDTVRQHMRISFQWVRGHNGNKWNEHVDKLCTKLIKQQL